MKNSRILRGIFLAIGAWSMGIRADAAQDFFSFFNSKEPLPAQLPSAPPEAASLLEMERILSRIRAGEKVETWRPLMARFCEFKGEKGVAAGLRELALAWEARARMQEWDAVLRKAYRKKARFPDSIDELLPTVPEELRVDPWGDPWGYAVTAPAHSPQLKGQRYILVPRRFPKLSPIPDAVKNPPQIPKVSIRFFSASGINSLQVDMRTPQPTRTFRAVGERFGSHWVMWLAPSGVVLCDEDGFLALRFQPGAQ